jgi:hypothetical protein
VDRAERRAERVPLLADGVPGEGQRRDQRLPFGDPLLAVLHEPVHGEVTELGLDVLVPVLEPEREVRVPCAQLDEVRARLPEQPPGQVGQPLGRGRG